MKIFVHQVSQTTQLTGKVCVTIEGLHFKKKNCLNLKQQAHGR